MWFWDLAVVVTWDPDSMNSNPGFATDVAKSLGASH